jgi:hypothetical protein
LSSGAIAWITPNWPIPEAMVESRSTAKSANIFTREDRLVLLHDGKLVPLSGTNLAEFIATNVVTVALKNTGSPDNPNWQKIYTPFRPPSKAAITVLLRAEKRDEGSLTARVPLAYIS